MKYDLLIKNGRVILDEGEQEVEVAVKDGKIAAIGHELGDAEKVIDAKGQVVAPGMVDAHVHITEPGGGYRDEWEGYETGLKGAAKGFDQVYYPGEIQEDVEAKYDETGIPIPQSIYDYMKSEQVY
ncbi:hypothetical protein SSIM_06785 [Staphylococcus simulans UMC-CNS-990]|uniref:Amidohydrolase 3 domain-containing protein n=1 Tax=Staphylococcus simulans UMC-CNS-990 TaxID=1405498 RepID=A0ABN0PCP7_STASI|nr:hypothetical protein SSIM_06785 [Staphylococcus simulans UMC-CNS-990]